jgi:hypothetical protein
MTSEFDNGGSGSGNNGGGNGGNGNPEALSFSGERGDSPGDLAWRAWRRSLEELSAFLAERSAKSAADEARLVARKAEAQARVAEAEAETARLEVEAELAYAAFERSLHQLRGGRLQ